VKKKKEKYRLWWMDDIKQDLRKMSANNGHRSCGKPRPNLRG